MAYDSVTELRGFPYTYRRRSLLECIFEDNVKLADLIDPYMGMSDIYDFTLSEQYDLYDGGDTGLSLAKDRLEQLKDAKEEYADDERILAYVDMLIDEYTDYIEHFVEKGV